MASGFWNIAKIPELRKKILFSLALLAVYRLGVSVTIPGVDRAVMAKYLNGQQGTLFEFFNLFSGNGLKQLSIFALGIMPYISSSIIMQLLGVVVPALGRLQKEGEQGRKKINQYTRYGTILLSIIQSVSIAAWIARFQVGNDSVVASPGVGFYLMTILTLTAGTVFIMWLGEQITEHGIGNGISLIIFAGIVAGLPAAISETIRYLQEGLMQPVDALIIVAIMVVVIAFIIFFERGQRRIPVQYAKRSVGSHSYGGQSTHLPLKVNSAGVIPPIFASSLLMFPATIAPLFGDSAVLEKITSFLRMNGLGYNTLYVLFIIFFCYFYTAVTFNPDDVADNLKKYGGYIPGIRPGKATAEYIDIVLSRITLAGAIYISAVCVLPTILIAKYETPFYFGGTSLLIVVGVALDTVQQIEGHLITRNYEGLTGANGPRIRGRHD